MGKDRIISFQVLRAIAFLCVFFQHNRFINGVFSTWGVSVFLMLSGFLNVYHDYNNWHEICVKKSIKYGMKKIKKIYMLHIVMCIFSFFLYCVSQWREITLGLPESVVKLVLKLFVNLMLISACSTINNP